MPSNDTLSDDYVASLLAKDAKDRTIKYSSLGLGALLPKRLALATPCPKPRPKFFRPTTNAPKPNTRFLKNIIKETDNHNAALKAKEAQEARARLRKLGQEPERWGNEDGSRSSKRRRIEDDEDDGVIRKGRGHKHPSIEKLRDGDERERRSHRRRHEYSDSDEQHAERSQRQRHRHGHHRPRSRDRSRDRESRRNREHGSKHRTRSRCPTIDRESKHHRSRRRRSVPTSQSSDTASRQKSRQNKNHSSTSSTLHPSTSHRSPSPTSSASSDPLASLIGPPPPPSPPKVRSRGRGTFATTSGIDNRFSSNYDPSDDIHPNSDSENDWDQALEALRDRQKWKQQGADRLREAGFTEQEVSKWEKGGKKGEEDVVWKGRGEGREWDRGKVVGSEEEEVETRADWGRLV